MNSSILRKKYIVAYKINYMILFNDTHTFCRIVFTYELKTNENNDYTEFFFLIF